MTIMIENVTRGLRICTRSRRYLINAESPGIRETPQRRSGRDGYRHSERALRVFPDSTWSRRSWSRSASRPDDLPSQRTRGSRDRDRDRRPVTVHPAAAREVEARAIDERKGSRRRSPPGSPARTLGTVGIPAVLSREESESLGRPVSGACVNGAASDALGGSPRMCWSQEAM
jgi:hypothetical protein